MSYVFLHGNHMCVANTAEQFFSFIAIGKDLGHEPSSSKAIQRSSCVTESSLSLAYVVLIIDKKETLVENFRILQFKYPLLYFAKFRIFRMMRKFSQITISLIH